MTGSSTCVAPQTAAPVLMRALNDIVPDSPVIVVTHMSTGVRVLEGREIQPSQLAYQRVGALIGHVLPEHEGGLPVLVEPPITLPPASSNVVVKWPDTRREKSHPLADHLRLRDLNSSPQ